MNLKIFNRKRTSPYQHLITIKIDDLIKKGVWEEVRKMNSGGKEIYAPDDYIVLTERQMKYLGILDEKTQKSKNKN